MNRKDRAINLGLKINSLKGNFSVAKSVIDDLEREINTASIDNEDRERLLVLYGSVVEDLKSIVSPSVDVMNRVNQLIEDANVQLKNSKTYIDVDNVEGLIKKIEMELNNGELEEEHRSSLKSKLTRLQEVYKKKIGFFLNKNFNKLSKQIKDECECENPYHVSVVIKSLNKKIKIVPLFNNDRHTLQALLDTYWQKASKDINLLKEEGERNESF